MNHAPIDAERYREMLEGLSSCPTRQAFDARFLIYFVDTRYPRLDLMEVGVAVLKAKGWKIFPNDIKQEDL